MKNIIVAQSGGPTTAINASLVGVIKGALSSGGYDKVFGALYGISGVMKEEFIQLEGLSDEELDSAIRFSLSRLTTKDEIDYTMEVLKANVALLRRFTKK